MKTITKNLKKGSKSKRENMRVLFLSDHLGYPNGVIHGATTYFISVLPQLRSQEVDLTVCFLRERHDAVTRLEKYGICPLFLNRSKWDPRVLSDLIEIIRQRDIQIVHAAGMKGILLGRIAARLTGRRAVIHLHDTRAPGWVLGSLQRMVAQWSDLAIVVSNAVGKLAINEFHIPQSRVQTMLNPLDISQFDDPSESARQRERKRFDIPQDVPVIGITGRLSEEKGHDVLIRSMPRILRQCPKAVLLIAGDGAKRQECEALVAQLGLEDSVRFAGYCSNIPDILAAIDVLALSSSREACSYSVMEAMAAQRPVVAFAVGGVPELLTDEETGLLVPPGDGTALGDAIVRVLANKVLAERLARAASKRIRRFSVRRHVTELKVGYQRLLDPVEQVEEPRTWHNS